MMLWVLWINLHLRLAWVSDPLNRYGAFAFLLWLAGSAWMAARSTTPARRVLSSCPVAAALAVMALALTAEIGQLKVAGQVALALGVASLLRPWFAALICLAAAAAWTPAWGWWNRQTFGDALDLYRLSYAAVLLAGGLLWQSYFTRRDENP